MSDSAPVRNQVKEPDASQKFVSGLSLKSISVRQKHQEKLKHQAKNEYEAHEDFSLKDVEAGWEAYQEKLNRKGRKILASIMATDKPKLKDRVIEIELPNETMKQDLQKEQGDLMKFLKRRLKNSEISLAIKVNREAAKKFVFTPKERYEKLKEKNPLVEKLKNTFDLDI